MQEDTSAQFLGVGPRLGCRSAVLGVGPRRLRALQLLLAGLSVVFGCVCSLGRLGSFSPILAECLGCRCPSFLRGDLSLGSVVGSLLILAEEWVLVSFRLGQGYPVMCVFPVQLGMCDHRAFMCFLCLWRVCWCGVAVCFACARWCVCARVRVVCRWCLWLPALASPR